MLSLLSNLPVILSLSTKYLRLSPFDTSSEQGRSDERYRLAFLSMVANILSRGTSMLVMVFTVSLTVRYLGAERFGVWMTIASFAGMLTFLDLGVGNALTNKVAQAAAQNDPHALQQTVSGGLGFLFAVGCAIGVLLFGLAQALPWDRLIKVQDSVIAAEILNTVAVFCVLFGFNIFTNGIQRVFAGLQRAFEAHAFSIAGSCISLCALWVAATQQAGIPYLLAATLGIQSLVNLGLLIVLARRGQFVMRLIPSHVRAEAPHLLNIGGLFFILQIGTMVGWGADSLIISSTLGAVQVASYSIVQRLFQFVSQPLSILNAPLWGAYADAHSRAEKSFIRRTLKVSLIGTSGLCLAGTVVLLAFGERIVDLWTENTVRIPLVLLGAYGSWAILDATGNALAMFLNGCGIVRAQVVTVLIFVLASLPAKLFLISKFGLVAMVAGQALIYLLVTSASYGAIFRKQLRETCL